MCGWEITSTPTHSLSANPHTWKLLNASLSNGADVSEVQLHNNKGAASESKHKVKNRVAPN